MHVASSRSLPSQEDNGHHAYNIMHGRERRYSHGSSMVLNVLVHRGDRSVEKF